MPKPGDECQNPQEPQCTGKMRLGPSRGTFNFPKTSGETFELNCTSCGWSTTYTVTKKD